MEVVEDLVEVTEVSVPETNSDSIELQTSPANAGLFCGYNVFVITNAQVALLLRRVASVFEVIDDDFFRTRAYQNAANAIENLTISARDLYQQGKLTEIPGVGVTIAGHLEELFKKGKVKYFDSELKRVPQGMFGLLGIRGVGPKISYKLSKHFKLKTEKTAKKELLVLINQGKLAGLEGFGEKLIEKIKTSIQNEYKGKVRMLTSEANQIANNFLDFLRSKKDIKDVQPLGSLRRHVSTVGDIDIAICSSKPEKSREQALKYPEINKIISSGENASRVQLKSGHEVDIKIGTPLEWGSLLQHYTGSKMHNIALRTYALSKNLSLSEHGIKNLKNGHIYSVKNETDFYHRLSLPYIPPELREGEEEIEWAKDGHVPDLINLDDIKGDLHLHTNFDYPTSHDLGSSPLSAILDYATNHKYQYLGLTDHNPKFKDLSLSDKKKILDKRRLWINRETDEYEKLVKTPIPKILVGLEIDIRSDGDLALEGELLDSLDYAIISVHSSFEKSKEENTARILKALSHPKALILGHPTGRLINQRDSIQADWLRIIDFCKKEGKVLEINSSPSRLDLPDDLVKIAIRSGVKVVINTDSHEISQMSQMEYGVNVARRGWVTKKDCINALNYTDLIKLIK